MNKTLYLMFDVLQLHEVAHPLCLDVPDVQDLPGVVHVVELAHQPYAALGKEVVIPKCYCDGATMH